MAYVVQALLIAGIFCNAFATDSKSSTVGREFVFGIFDMIGSCCHSSSNIITVDITNTSPNRTLVRMQIPCLNKDTNFDIPTGKYKTLLIDPSIQRDATFKDTRGIKISADHDISVLVTNMYGNGYIDSYNIIPIAELGNSYYISSYISDSSGKGSEVLVAAVKDNTKVTLKNQTDVIQSMVLNEFEIFQFLKNQVDLTGTHVDSDNNVYVVSGSTYTGIPSGGTGYIASEMFPVSTWSNSYIIPPVLPKSAFMIRIVTNSSSDVTIANSTRTYKLKPSMKDQYFGTETIVATSQSPFAVTQYGVNPNYDNIAGGPFMVAVPGIDKYINEYIFTVPRENNTMKYHAAIIAPKTGISGLVLNNRSIQSYNSTIITVPPPFDEFKIVTFPINEGFHHFYHPIRTIKYGVFIYGHGNSLSNSFFAGYDLKETKQMCYSCDDLSHIDLCDTVKQCDNHEVCYVERNKDGGQFKYKSGCLPRRTCESKRYEATYSDDICFECCSGNYCNNQGCGENGIPNRDKRGPICFDCQHVSSPDECVNITPCDPNQVCRIEEFKWFDHLHYKLGCGHGLCDPVSRKRSHVFKRSTPVCQSCCTDDYCNKYCTASTEGQTGTVIVG